jgi:hypothetical protein
VLGVLLGVTVAVFIAVRLGPSLAGNRVFLGMGLLDLFAPWSSLPGAQDLHTSLFVSDQIDWSIPALTQIHDRLWNGDIANWSNLAGGGSPLLANPDFGVFSPGRWVFLLLPPWLAPAWAKLLEMAFAWVFSYLLVRRLSGSRIAAALAGVIYPLTGFMIGWTNWPQVAVACVIPMMFWSIERFVQEKTLRSAVPIALAVALLLFGGFPAVAGLTLYAAGAYAVVRIFTGDVRRLSLRLRDLAVVVAGVGFGLGLSAVQLLPFAHQLLGDTDLSYRAQGFFTRTPAIYLMTAMFPGIFSGNGFQRVASPQDLNAYVGAAALLLVAMGIVRALAGGIRRSAGVYFVALGLFVVALIWVRGPWSDWLNNLPVFHGNPIGRVRSQLALPAAVLAAAGLDTLRGRPAPGSWIRTDSRAFAWLSVAAAVVVTVVVTGVGIRVAAGTFGGAISKWPDVLLAAIPVIAIGALVLIGLRWRPAWMVAAAVAVVAVVIQAFPATSFYWPTSSRSQFYPETSGIAYLQQHQGSDREATLGYTLRPNVSSQYGLRTINAHGFFPRPMQQLLRAIDPASFVAATENVFSTTPGPYLASPGLARLGIRYLATDNEAVMPGTRNVPVPIPGTLDPMPPLTGRLALLPGQQYRVAVPNGPVRGVSIPLTATTELNVRATVVGPDGAIVTQNIRQVDPGTWNVPIVLADDRAGVAPANQPSGSLTISVTVDQAGGTATTDASGHLRLQAVRPPAKSDGGRVAYADDDMIVWERTTYLPRIHWASRAVVITDDAARLAAAAKSLTDPNTVILSAPPPAELGNADTSAQQLTVKKDTGDILVVDAAAPTSGFVVVSDNVQNDFTATVDGKTAPIVDADYAVGAVYMPAGQHEVTLTYAPRGRTFGAVVSLVSTAVLIVAALPAAWWLFRRRRRQKEASPPTES